MDRCRWDTNKETYEKVKNDPVYVAVKEYWEFIGTMDGIAQTQRKFNISACKVMTYRSAYKHEKSNRANEEQTELSL